MSLPNLPALLVLSLLLSTKVGADFDAGFAASEAGDHETAFREWKPLAEQGDASAQFGLGVLYAQGEGVPQDDKEALKWYTKMA